MSTSANRDPIDVVFIFDKSGSMDENVNGIKKIQRAKVDHSKISGYTVTVTENSTTNKITYELNGSATENGKTITFAGAEISEINTDKGKGTRTIGTNENKFYSGAIF
ncbi:hypothetical protein V7152_19990 [Neobacillus drentensis]|uniref:hypothetical protein n=1 Tax=Neobacillus drentensis TaxID=220684 RepID=UPI002FFE5DA3